MNVKTTSISFSVISIALAFALSACGNKSETKTATQVAAKVGAEEISVHQINQVLSRTNSAGATPEKAKALGKEVLEKLIDQQLAVNQATETKLHRSPEVVSQIEASRREILARAYLQKIASALPKPTPEEVKQYFIEHPQLFSERRIFNVQEIVVPTSAGVTDQLRSFATAGKPIEEAANWLKGKDIKFGGGSATRSAEQIPLELLPKIHALKDGQSIVIQGGQATTLLRVATSQPSPVPEANALPRIELFLTNQRANEAVVANIKQLRTNAEISYLGDFAKVDTATDGAAPVKPQSNPIPATDDQKQSAIEKGVAGLK